MSIVDGSIPNAFAQQPLRVNNEAAAAAVMRLRRERVLSHENIRLHPPGWPYIDIPPKNVVGGALCAECREAGGCPQGGCVECGLMGGAMVPAHGIYAPGVTSNSGVLAGSAGMAGFIPASSEISGVRPSSFEDRAKNNAAAVGGIRFVDPLLARPII